MNDADKTFQEKITLPCDNRYRNSKYFLEDQLRCSEAAADFKSVKELLNRTPSFCVKNSFQFQMQAVPIHIDQSQQ